MRGTSLLSVVTACVLFACADPVYDDAIAKLGGEAAGVRPGPLHRPGQPCVLCHSSRGGQSEFSLAGTVYVDAASPTPIEDVNVRVVDSQNRKFVAQTNCAGNFFVTPKQFAPDFPIWIGLESLPAGVGGLHRFTARPRARVATATPRASPPPGTSS